MIEDELQMLKEVFEVAQADRKELAALSFDEIKLLLIDLYSTKYRPAALIIEAFIRVAMGCYTNDCDQRAKIEALEELVRTLSDSQSKKYH